MFAVLLLLAALGSGSIRDPEHHYTCKIERSSPMGSYGAEVRVSEAGVRERASFTWFSPGAEPKVSIGRHWGGWSGQEVLASVSHYYGRRGQRIRFSFESPSGETLLRTAPVPARRMSFFYSLSWDHLATMARRSGSPRIRAIAPDGKVLSEHILSAAQIDQVEREAGQLEADLDAMTADYRNQCASSRDVIVMIG